MRIIIFLACISPFYLQAQTPVEKGKLLFESKQHEEAKVIFQSVKKGDKDYDDARYWLGRVAFDQKKLDDAVDYFDEAIEANDKEPLYYNWLGNAYGNIAQDANPFKQGLLAPKMKNAWEKAMSLDPKDVESRLSLIQFYTKAPGFMGGSMTKAKEMAKQIMTINAAQGHRAMGNIWVQEKNMGEAEKEYLEMVKADPTFIQALGNFYVNQKQYDRGFTLFEEILKRNPSDIVTHYQIGKCSALSGQRLDRGEECLKKYLDYTPKQFEPSHAGANMRLAQITEKRGKKAEAKKLYETALRLDGKLKEAQEGLDRTSK